MGNFITQEQLKTNKKMGGCRPEGNITDPRNTWIEETARTQR